MHLALDFADVSELMAAVDALAAGGLSSRNWCSQGRLRWECDWPVSRTDGGQHCTSRRRHRGRRRESEDCQQIPTG